MTPSRAFAHDAVIGPDGVGDLRGPGGAVTLELCGSWDHEPPCPVAAHHTDAEAVGDEVRLRILFACDSTAEAAVRTRIDAALARGTVTGPDGVTTSWRLLRSGPGAVREDERAHADRLLRG